MPIIDKHKTLLDIDQHSCFMMEWRACGCEWKVTWHNSPYRMLLSVNVIEDAKIMKKIQLILIRLHTDILYVW